MNTPKVSIGMPVYNGENFIKEALDSLLAQTFTDFELIISDNASTDETEAICQDYAAKDMRIRYIRQTENRGAIANFKFVLDEAVGEYFMWAAADDIWSHEFIMTCNRLLSDNNQAGMAMTAYEVQSLTSFIFNLRFRNPLDCIENPSNIDRIKSYTKLSFWTHKDNLVYALWRKVLLKKILSDLSSIFNGSPLIGASMNEYSLGLYPGVYSPKVLFHKRYRYIPPGHLLYPLFIRIVWLINKIRNKQSTSSRGTSAEQRLIQLVKVMELLNFDTPFIEEVVLLNKQHMNFYK